MTPLQSSPTGSILYLHGLGSGPRSRKAELIRAHFTRLGFEVSLPSITLPSLERLSPRAVLSFVREEVVSRLNGPFFLIGSSFGAFIATHALRELSAKQRDQVNGAVLIAPVFDPFDEHGGLLTGERQRVWREKGEFPLLDIEAGVERLVHYRFVEELRELVSEPIKYRVPTLVIHGTGDEVVPCRQSEAFAASRPWVETVFFNDDHQILRDPPGLLNAMEGFILSKSPESR